jgi:hypothetical protein
MLEHLLTSKDQIGKRRGRSVDALGGGWHLHLIVLSAAGRGCNRCDISAQLPPVKRLPDGGIRFPQASALGRLTKFSGCATIEAPRQR